MSRVTMLRAEPVHYHAPEGPCTGTNLIYLVDGSPRSSRVPWVVNDVGAERQRLERLLERTGH